MNLARTLVMGNSGSGKSWLAERIAAISGGGLIDLDHIFWEPGGFNVARDKAEASLLLARTAATTSSWVIEGIYGALHEQMQGGATALIWLCVDEAACADNIRARGIRRGGTEATLANLISWAQTYRSRQGSSSFQGHQATFDSFPTEKIRLSSKLEVTAFADHLSDAWPR